MLSKIYVLAHVLTSQVDKWPLLNYIKKKKEKKKEEEDKFEMFKSFVTQLTLLVVFNRDM